MKSLRLCAKWVGAIGELLGCGQVANIGGSLPLGIFDKWQNHFSLFVIYPLVIRDFIFAFFPFFIILFSFFFSIKVGGVIFPIELRNHFFDFLKKLNQILTLFSGLEFCKPN